MATKSTTRDIKPFGRPRPTVSHHNRRLRAALGDADRDLLPWARFVLGRAVAELPSEHWEAERIQAVGAVDPYGCAAEDLREVRAAVRRLRDEGELDETRAALLEVTLDRLDGWAAELAERRARYGLNALLPTDFSESTAFHDFKNRVAAEAAGNPHYTLGHAVGGWLAGIRADGQCFLPGRWDRPKPKDCGRLWGFETVVTAYRDLPVGTLCVPELDQLVRSGVIEVATRAAVEAAFAGRLLGWQHMVDEVVIDGVQTSSIEDAVRELADEMSAHLLRHQRATVAPEPAAPPVWDPVTGTLVYAGYEWTVATQAVRIRAILDAFQECHWSAEVTVFTEVVTSQRRRRVHNTVTEVNAKFTAERGRRLGAAGEDEVAGMNEKFTALQFKGSKQGRVSWAVKGPAT